jgi:glycerophosphoryl diester phosphodiesterase
MVSEPYVTRWKKRGLAVGTYTVNDPDEGARLATLGVDWIFTDAPGAMLARIRAL